MNLRKHLFDVYDHLKADEDLIRLLHYIPEDGLDDPLDTSKNNLVESDEYYDILNKCFVTTNKTFDLVDEPFSRLCMYNGNRSPQRNNFYAHDQDFVFDIYVHYSIDQMDGRLNWICERLNTLMNNKEVTGAGDVRFLVGHPITNSPEFWIGYKMVYTFVGLEP